MKEKQKQKQKKTKKQKQKNVQVVRMNIHRTMKKKQADENIAHFLTFSGPCVSSSPFTCKVHKYIYTPYQQVASVHTHRYSPHVLTKFTLD